MIPIYRTKKIDSDEWVEGSLIGENYITDCEPYYDEGYTVRHQYPSNGVCESTYGEDWHLSDDVDKIDPKTLAIHFPNMIDKNDKRIFASLSEDGVGGDKGINPRWVGRDNPQNEMVYVYKNKSFVPVFILDTESSPFSAEKDFEVIRIHKGKDNDN